MWSTVCEVISLKAVDEQMQIRPCYGGWAYCNGDCSQCKQTNTTYSDKVNYD